MDPREEIKRRVDVVDLVGETLSLKSAGGGSFKALCPFHMEKTPSFYLSREKQIWHCFGCGEGGDVFSWIMKMEGVEFSESLRILAKRAGVEIPRYASAQTNENERLIRVNEFAAACYQKILSSAPVAAAARAYVAQRGISSELVEKFGLGFAPDSWSTLTDLLTKKNIPLKDAERAGLLLPRRSGSGYIDRFRHRLIIPLRDARGQVVAFVGRIMPGAKDNEGPKYLNSSETPIYHKGELLFGLDLAKNAIKLKKEVIIVEGNLDVVASHKAGVENVVASSGTALTEQQLEILHRLTTTLIFSFDQDAAGFNAARRGLHLARQYGFQIKIALLPAEAGKDPDEAVQKDPELWRQTVIKTVPVMEYLIERTTKGRDLSKVEVKKEVGEILLSELAAIPNVIEREHWLQIVADLLRTDLVVLRNSLASFSEKKEQQKFSDNYNKTSEVLLKKTEKPRSLLATELIFSLFLHAPALQEKKWEKISLDILPEGELRELYTFLDSGYTYSRFLPEFGPSYFVWVRDAVQAAEKTSLVSLIIRLGIQSETIANRLSLEEMEKELDAQLNILESELHEVRRRTLEAEIRHAEGQGDKDKVTKLMREYQNLC